MSRAWREKVPCCFREFRTESYERQRSSRVHLKELDAVDCICCAIAVSELWLMAGCLLTSLSIVRTKPFVNWLLIYLSVAVMICARMTSRAITCPEVHLSIPSSLSLGRIHKFTVPQQKLMINNHTWLGQHNSCLL